MRANLYFFYSLELTYGLSLFPVEFAFKPTLFFTIGRTLLLEFLQYLRIWCKNPKPVKKSMIVINHFNLSIEFVLFFLLGLASVFYLLVAF